MKKEKTYRRFNLISFLAILGCIGMLAFESIFVFELYDRFALQPETPVFVEPEVKTTPEKAPKETVVVPVKNETPKPVKTPVEVKPATPVMTEPAKAKEFPEMKTEPVKTPESSGEPVSVIILE